MEITPEEGLLLLRKWQAERRVIDVRFSVGRVKSFLLGRLVLEGTTLMIAGPRPEIRVEIELVAASYIYRDTREAPEPARKEVQRSYDGILTIRLPEAPVNLYVLHELSNS